MSREVEVAEQESSREKIGLGPDTLVILDLDRTLIDSDRLADITLLSLEDSLGKSDMGSQETKQAIAAIEVTRQAQQRETGNSFPYLEYLQTEMGASDMVWAESLAEQVLDINRDPGGNIKPSFVSQIMLPGAIDLLDQIDRSQSDKLIMTAGKKVTQRYKLALVQAILTEHKPDAATVSYLVTDPDHVDSKADMIRSSYAASPAGLLQFNPGILAGRSDLHLLSKNIADRRYGRVVLLDDKLKNLQYQDSPVGTAAITTVLVKADNRPDRQGQSLVDIQKRFY